MRLCLMLLAVMLFRLSAAQDTAYARQIIRALTSKKCFGRGYLKKGLHVAADYLTSEMKKQGIKPLFAKGYLQPFTFDVNTFPAKTLLKIDGKILTPGVDFIPDPGSTGIKGSFAMKRNDSVSFSASGEAPLKIILKRKLTFSVSQSESGMCGIQLLNKNNYNDIRNVEIDLQNKLLKSFRSNNVCGFVNGTDNNDSLIVFSAHYDHLGGLGKETFFPGANDNASGVSVLLNLAASYKKNPPRYKTLFLFFAGEEAGLMGSRFFVNSKAVDLSKIKFLVNLDLLGTGDDGIMVVNGAVHEKQFALINEINSNLKLVKDIRKRGKAQNSDHYWFSEAGVPGFFIYTLGGVSSYHDVYDIEKTLPLTAYIDVCHLIMDFAARL